MSFGLLRDAQDLTRLRLGNISVHDVFAGNEIFCCLSTALRKDKMSASKLENLVALVTAIPVLDDYALPPNDMGN